MFELDERIAEGFGKKLIRVEKVGNIISIHRQKHYSWRSSTEMYWEEKTLL